MQCFGGNNFTVMRGLAAAVAAFVRCCFGKFLVAKKTAEAAE